MSLLPLKDKGIYAEGLFLNLDRQRGGVPVTPEIMVGRARFGGQEWDPAATEFMARRLRIFQTEAGNVTVRSGKRHGDGDNDDAGKTMTRGLRYISFCCKIKEFMLR